ncbi:hypothetical protein GCM10022217_04020 [Chryseobacterium ginsenosidimutans]
MTGYELYNTMTRQWEYYETSQRNSTQYRDPVQPDISSLGNAASTLQNRYNNNTSYLQQQVSAMVQSVYDLDLTDEEKTKIVSKFQNESLRIVNTRAYNYSSLSETNRVLNYLRESLNKIIRNVTASSSNDSYQSNSLNDYDNKITANYGRTLPVYNIAIFDSNNKRIKDETILTNSYILINEDKILFKKANGELSYRDLKDKIYNKNKAGYEYSSEWGRIFIHQDLKYVEFFQKKSEENYTYYITPLGNR